MEEYELDDTPISAELLAEAERISACNNEYTVYYDADTGSILAISNEEQSQFDHWFKVPYTDIEYLFQQHEILENYKVKTDGGKSPQIILKQVVDNDPISFLKKVENETANTELVIEQNLLRNQWVFSLTDETRQFLIDSGVNEQLRFYLTDPLNKNFIIRTITINFKELYVNKIYTVPFESKLECNKDIKIETNNFLNSVGHRVANEQD